MTGKKSKSGKSVHLKRLVVLLAIIIIVLMINSWTTNKLPECYLIEQNEKCFNNYDERYSPCWEDLLLKQCCKGIDYIMKGVYGDVSCPFIMAGQDIIKFEKNDSTIN